MERLPGDLAVNRRVICWRHGRTAWNVAGRVQGQTDTQLDEVGVQQAKDAAARLASLKPARIFSSDLQRAATTAQALGDLTGVRVETDPRLREMSFGAREGMTWAQSWEHFPEGMAAWAAGDETNIPGSETHLQAGERFAAALTELLDQVGPDETVVVVAHGAVLRTGVCAFIGIEHASWRRLGALANCHWAVLQETSTPDGEPWRLAEWNAGTLPEPVLSDDD